MANMFVKLGDKAGIFRDQSLNLTIRKGEVVTINLYQQNSKKVKAALNGGHLVVTTDPKLKQETQVKTPEDLYEEFKGMLEVEKDTNKIIKYFTLDQFKSIASVANIEVEESDTKKSIFEALVSE